MAFKHPGILKMILLLISTMLGLTACKKDDFSFNYSSTNVPKASLVLAPTQALYTSNRNIDLQLSAQDPFEMAFFIDKACVYREVSAWEPYSDHKQIQLPDLDGSHEIWVLFRTSAHFPSECQSVKVVLDRQGPASPAAIHLTERTSTTTSTPNFSFDIATDTFSPIKGYQARILKSSDNSEVLTWTDIATLPGGITALNSVLISGSSYVLEVRAQDYAENYGTSIRSSVFYAGLTFNLAFTDSNSVTTNCATDSCIMTTGVYRLNMNLNFPAPEDLTIQYSTQDYTALAGYDYFTTSGTLTIPNGSSSASFLINIHDSPQPGPNRSFKVNFTSSLSSTALTNFITVRSPDGNGSVAKSVTPSFTKFSLGAYHSCGSTSDNKIFCWGLLFSTLPAPSSSAGYEVTGLGTDSIVQVASSYGGSCALFSTGALKCWDYMFLSPYINNDQYDVPTTITDFTNVSQFSISKSSSAGVLCAVLTDGTIRCAGSNSKYQLGTGSTGSSSVSVLVNGFKIVGTDPVAQKVVVGNNFACALTTGGSVYCWGKNDKGQLGVATSTTSLLSPTLVAGLPSMKDIEIGYKHICGVSNDDRLFCWGDNTYSQLGLVKTTTYSATPIEITGQTGIQSLAIGNESNCMIRRISSVDKVFCWGRNLYGGVGIPYFGYYTTPQEMTNFPGTPIALSAGDKNEAMCGVNSLHEIYCWGASYASDSIETGLPFNNDYIFNSSSVSNSKFVEDAQDIFLQNFTFCTKDAAGRFRCRGTNTLGSSPKISYNDIYPLEPQLVSSDPLQDVSFSRYNEHSCYLSMDNLVWCRGQNNAGQLGLGTTVDSMTYQQVPSLTNVKLISTGDLHTCAVTSLNTVYCWGANDYGQLGFAPASPFMASTPTYVAGLPVATIKKIVSTAKSNCVLYNNGQIYCWGSGGSGQIGSGSSASTQDTPTQVSSAQTFTSITAGFSNVCAIADTGKAFCWGLNSDGSIGDGTTVNRNIPTQVASATGISFVSLSTTQFGTCGATTSGEVYCWGWNGAGGLGTGDTTSSNTPVKVLGIAGGAVKVVSAEFFDSSFSSGSWYTCALIQLNGVKQDTKCWGSSQLDIGTLRGSRTTPQKMTIDSTSP